MNQKMHLVCLKDTGHVLAGVAATTAEDPKLEALVGDALPVANTRVTVGKARSSLIPVDLLELKSVPFDAAVIGDPLSHVVDGGRVERLPPVQSVIVTEFDENVVTLKDGLLDRKVVVVLSEAEDPRAQWRVQSGKFVDADNDGNVDDLDIGLSVMPQDTPAPIEAGKDYLIMTASEGDRIAWAEDQP